MSRSKSAADRPRGATEGGETASVVRLAERWPWPAQVAPLKPDPWQYTGAYDPERSDLAPLPLRLQDGRALREVVPHGAHGTWKPVPGRPDPIELLHKTNEGRQERLVPLRMGRMAASPFGFLRGA